MMLDGPANKQYLEAFLGCTVVLDYFQFQYGFICF